MRHARSSPKNSGIPDLTYRVGYKRPPQHTQFKKGQSGNSNGRPKETKNWSTVFAEELDRRITVTVDGQKTEVTVLEALIRQAVERAAAGSLPHLHLLLGHEYREPPEPCIVRLEEGSERI